MPGHLNESPGVGGLEETPRAPPHDMDRPAAEGRGQAGVNVVDSSTGSPAVGAGRHGPQGLRGMRSGGQYHVNYKMDTTDFKIIN